MTQKALITVVDKTVELTNFALNKVVEVDGFTNESEAGEMVVDGKLDTKWCAVGPRKHNVTIDLGKAETINQVSISHAEAGGESADMNTSDYIVEVSADKQNWTEVANVKKIRRKKHNTPLSNVKHVMCVSQQKNQLKVLTQRFACMKFKYKV